MNVPEEVENIGSSRLIAAAIVGPFLLLSIALWGSHLYVTPNANFIILSVIGISVLVGGICFSRGLKRWPKFDYLLMVYLLAVPIALTVFGFLITVYVYGDGP